jgi:hypothetical protein
VIRQMLPASRCSAAVCGLRESRRACLASSKSVVFSVKGAGRLLGVGPVGADLTSGGGGGLRCRLLPRCGPGAQLSVGVEVHGRAPPPLHWSQPGTDRTAAGLVVRRPGLTPRSLDLVVLLQLEHEDLGEQVACAVDLEVLVPVTWGVPPEDPCPRVFH